MATEIYLAMPVLPEALTLLCNLPIAGMHLLCAHLIPELLMYQLLVPKPITAGGMKSFFHFTLPSILTNSKQRDQDTSAW